MKISLQDYLVLVQELMIVIGYTQDQVDEKMTSLQKGYLSLDDLTANIAVQCFIQKHQSPNSDIVRNYLIERQNDDKVEFGDV